jgi:hypothetical protein
MLVMIGCAWVLLLSTLLDLDGVKQAMLRAEATFFGVYAQMFPHPIVDTPILAARSDLPPADPSTPPPPFPDLASRMFNLPVDPAPVISRAPSSTVFASVSSSTAMSAVAQTSLVPTNPQSISPEIVPAFTPPSLDLDPVPSPKPRIQPVAQRSPPAAHTITTQAPTALAPAAFAFAPPAPGTTLHHVQTLNQTRRLCLDVKPHETITVERVRAVAHRVAAATHPATAGMLCHRLSKGHSRGHSLATVVAIRVFLPSHCIA